jgi:hypothetical protein
MPFTGRTRKGDPLRLPDQPYACGAFWALAATFPTEYGAQAIYPGRWPPRSLIGGKQPDRGKLGQTKGDPLA